jgi:four helix bundle protein
MDANSQSLEDRTERFALDVIKLIRGFSNREPAMNIARQLSKSATSVGANYRASRRARSHAEFTSRIGIVAEEADETIYWLQLVAKAGISNATELPGITQEARELTAIFSAMVRTARHNERNAKRLRD